MYVVKQEVASSEEQFWMKSAALADLHKSDEKFDGKLSVIREVGPIQTDHDSVFVKEFCEAVGAQSTKAVGFTTDAPHLTSLGAPIVIFGPGKVELCHKPDEYIDIVDLEKGTKHFENIILRFLS